MLLSCQRKKKPLAALETSGYPLQPQGALCLYKTFGALPHVGGVTWLDGEKFSMCRRGSKSVSTKASPHKGSKNKRSSPEKSCTAKASDVNKQAGASSNGLHEDFPALRSVSWRWVQQHAVARSHSHPACDLLMSR